MKQKTIDRGRFYTTEDLGAKRSTTPEGFLVCQDVPIARTGMQRYTDEELPLEGINGEVRIDRLEEEVFRAETIASFEGKAVTVEHPNEFVSPENWQQLAIGTVQNVRRGSGIENDLLIADLVITDAKAIEYVNKSLPEVSAGYEAAYEQTEPGRGVQRDIVGNHVALVERGRAGPRCSIKDEEPKMKKRSFWDRIMTAVKAKDADAVKEELESMDADGDDKDDEKEKDKDKTGDSLGKILSKLASMDADIQDLKKTKDAKSKDDDDEDGDETTDTVLEAEKADKDDTAKVLSGDSLKAVLSRAEILVPGFALKTTDGKAATVDVDNHMRAVLEKACATDEGKALVAPFLAGRELKTLTGDSLASVFTGAAELARAKNNSAGTRKSAATRDFGPTQAVTAINARNRDFWANRSAR